MNQRQIIFIALMVTVPFTIMILLIVGVYKYKPTWLGLAPRKEDSLNIAENLPLPIVDSTLIVPTIEITREKFDELQSSLLNKELLEIQRDSLFQQKLRLSDSIMNINNLSIQSRDSVKKYRDTAIYHDQSRQKLVDSISNLSQLLLKSQSDLKLAQQRIKDQEKLMVSKYDSSEKSNFENYARIYNNANPRDVAKILEQIDDRDAAMILKSMSKKKAGKVLEALVPQKAASIMLLGIGD